jgi:hypothetical protein
MAAMMLGPGADTTAQAVQHPLPGGTGVIGAQLAGSVHRSLGCWSCHGVLQLMQQ